MLKYIILKAKSAKIGFGWRNILYLMKLGII
jgi:hypothetical protein